MTQMALRLYQTSVGKKGVMALTGLPLSGFVLVHMIGNLQFFAGADALDGYAALLHRSAPLLWGLRLLLLSALALHVVTGALLIVEGLRARPQGYAGRRYLAVTTSSRTMRWSGPLMLLFIGFHLLHFTTGQLHPDFVAGEVFRNLLLGLAAPAAAAAYYAGVILLGLHLKHGLWSLMQTLGLNGTRTDGALRALAAVAAVAVVLGFLSIPTTVLAGLAG